MIPSVFSAINIVEFPGLVLQQQLLFCQKDPECNKTIISDETALAWYRGFLKHAGMPDEVYQNTLRTTEKYFKDNKRDKWNVHAYYYGYSGGNFTLINNYGVQI